MSEFHLAYLNLGSNIQPETNLPKAVKLLSNYGEIQKISNIWESEPVGTQGDNYLNLCLSFNSPFNGTELKSKVIRLIENRLGRKRGRDKFASRTMDIDIILVDNQPTDKLLWHLAYVVIPLAEIYPNFQIPHTGKLVHVVATELRREAWLRVRPDLMDNLRGSAAGN